LLDKKLIEEKAENIQTELIEWRRRIHQNPELGFKEYQTSDFIAAKLNEFGIEYEADVDKALEVLAAELPKTRDIIPSLVDDPVCVGVTSLADSSVNLRVVAKTMTEQHYGVERILRKEIKKILDNHGIGIPFPQVVVHQAKEE